MAATGRMAGRVALVTGSTSGVGRGIAERFAREGARVVVTGRRAELGRAVADGIAAAGGEATYIGADLADGHAAARLVTETAATWGAIDTLVNNAADAAAVRSTDGPLHTTDEEAWDAMYRSSLRSALTVTKTAIPYLQRSGRGRVINISSVMAVRGSGFDTYSWVKAALLGLTRSMAASYASDGIRVNCLTLGYVAVERSTAMFEAPEMQAFLRQISLTRVGMPSDVAHACTWLGSDEGEYVTGAVIAVDGGIGAKGPTTDPGSHLHG